MSQSIFGNHVHYDRATNGFWKSTIAILTSTLEIQSNGETKLKQHELYRLKGGNLFVIARIWSAEFRTEDDSFRGTRAQL